MRYDILVIGGGPAGMTAAITAARAGARVCLVEHKDRVGSKILSTGNGKCNITNLVIAPECYRSDSGADYYDVISRFNPQWTIEYMKSLGIITKERNGYIYPRSEQASTVLDGLRGELVRLKVDVVTQAEVTRITPSFTAVTSVGDFSADRLVLACGSKCAPKTGSDGSGYQLAKTFGHKIITPIPALVQIRCKEGFFKEVQGVRCEASVSVMSDNGKAACDRGELQLTDYGISGIPVFQVSRYIKRLLDAGKKPYVLIDFVPDMTASKLHDTISYIIDRAGGLELLGALNGIFNKKLAGLLIKEAGLKPSCKCSMAGTKELERLEKLIKAFKATPVDTNGFANAQVCAGGVDLKEINQQTMESRLVKKLYFAGEIVDVDGKCGGYNLQWAFASGHQAGLCITGVKNDKN